MDERTNEMNGSTANNDESPDKIRDDIVQTRAEMSETIDAIQEKIDPQHIKEQALEKVHDATIGRAQTLAETAKEKVAAVSERVSDAPTPQDKGAVILDLIKRHPLPAGLAALLLLFVVRKIFGGNSRQKTRDNEYEIRSLRRRDWDL